MIRIFLLSLVLLLCMIDTFSQEVYDNELIQFDDLLYVDEDRVVDDSLQRLNLVLPSRGGSVPLLIWIGGGAWSYGDRNQEMNLARNLANQGIAVASLSHRMSPATWRDSSLREGVQHPLHMHDVAAATRFLIENDKVYGYDLDKLFVGGYSSGAHLAALLVMDPQYLGAEDLSIDIFKGVIPISGAYDIENYHQVFLESDNPELAELHVQAVFGTDKEGRIKSSPTNYLSNLEIPMLLMCDNGLYNYTRLFEDKIRETDFRNVRVVYAYDFSHGDLWKDLSSDSPSFYRNIIIDFIQPLTKSKS